MSKPLRAGAKALWRALSSLSLTIWLLSLFLILVLIGTLEQVPLGTYLAQKKYFSSWWIYWDTDFMRIPVFPGGLSLGTAWLVNLAAAHGSRFAWRAKRAGIILAHSGLFLLVLGQGLSQIFARESRMAIAEGQAAQFSEDYRATELAITDGSLPEEDVVTVIPASLLAREGDLDPPGLPFHLRVRQFFPNAQLARGSSPATRGIGTGISVEEAPPVTAEDEADNVTALVEISAGSESLGTWLVSTALGAPQTLVYQGREYRLAMRPARYYYPFRLFLKDFRHDRYPGTDIPKNFSSLVRLTDPGAGEDRDVLIYMNHPLRYAGLTFFQQSFGEGDRLSVIQVVRNPIWMTPYLACALVALGLVVQFGTHLAAFVRRQE